ncbi:glutamate--tRNA ligase [PVC group bacterium]|nr:glutamate--tRNA ligase [PVC group bacterium]
MTVRTRVAPSPTGAPHIGTAYIALFNYAFAKSQKGEFILRIEDTDQVRSTKESETEILDALKWVGLPWDEGPDVGGSFGPYRQSERYDIYREHCTKLVESGKAYPCFCTPERLKDLRKQQETAKDGSQGYDGLCTGIPPDDAKKRIADGEQHVVRLKVPEDGDCVINDSFRGEIRIPWNTVDDQVLLKTDGFPTYHLANVVDDHLMKISHVIRGEEWISSTPKHILLYDAFGWKPPVFAHLPLLRNPDKSKLSKRKNPTSILYYKTAGFLPEALVNFLGLMAYSPPDGQEQFSLSKMIKAFDLNRIHLGGPIFDFQKLCNFNGRYLREMNTETLMKCLRNWMLNDKTWQKVIPLAQPRLNQLTDFVQMSSFLFSDKLKYDSDLLLKSMDDPGRAAEIFKIAQWEFEKLCGWHLDDIKEVFARVAEKEDIKFKKLLSMFFVALTGDSVSLPLFDSMVILGRDMCLRRIQYALNELDAKDLGLTKKKLKRMSKDYDYRYKK